MQGFTVVKIALCSLKINYFKQLTPCKLVHKIKEFLLALFSQMIDTELI